MIGLREINFLLIFVSFVLSEDYSADLYDRSYDPYLGSDRKKMENGLDREATVTAIRKLVNDLENRMMKRTPSFGVSCLGAGLSHNCEFNDLKDALRHVEQLNSGHFPGRRKRSTATPLQPDGNYRN